MKLEEKRLNVEQGKALEILNSGVNVFLTGNAGTGKSFLIDYFINSISKYKRVLVCAPTGLAALNIGGTTIHRAFKAPLEPISPYKTGEVTDVVYEADVIVIDEISMCRVDLFGFVSRILNYKSEVLGKDTQLIVVGDFFQLPPVITGDDLNKLLLWYPGIDDGFCFDSVYWSNFNFTNIRLTQVMRQSDENYISNLNKARVGDLSCLNYFNQCVNRYIGNAVCLTAYNKVANQINSDRLEELNGKKYSFKAIAFGDVSEKEYPTNYNLDIKIGARVMCLVNDLEYRFVNGSFGTVVGVEKGNNCVIVDVDGYGEVPISKYTFTYYDYKVDGNNLIKTERGSFTQFPLKLAYAITIHKSQGQTYDKVYIKPKAFAKGQLYVALSRCKSFNNISLDYQIIPDYLRVSPKVLNFSNTLNTSDIN